MDDRRAVRFAKEWVRYRGVVEAMQPVLLFVMVGTIARTRDVWSDPLLATAVVLLGLIATFRVLQVVVVWWRRRREEALRRADIDP